MRVLRGAVLTVGLGVLTVLGLVEWTLRRRPDRATGPDPVGEDLPPVTPVAAPVSRTQLVLGAVGVLVAGYGVAVGLQTVPWTSVVGLALWLLGGVVLHDAVLVPALSVLRAAAHRLGRRLPTAALDLITTGFVVGGVLSLVAVPEIWAQRLGPLNPTVLPGAYGQGLLITWVVVLGATLLGVVVVVLRARRAGAVLRASAGPASASADG